MSKKQLRLNQIIDLAQPGYECIYDLCCDHGIVGKELSKKYPKTNIYLIDRVKEITDKLSIDSYITKANNIEVFQKDATKTQFKKNTKNLFIYCGIGAELSFKITDNILNQYKTGHCDFIICAHQHIDKLHEDFERRPFDLLDFKLVHENGQYFEIFYLRLNHAKNGLKMGEYFKLIQDKEYLSSRINYLNHKLSFKKCPKISSKVEFYQKYLNKLCS